MCKINSLKEVSDIISIVTPLILLIWFYYSQKQRLSKSYFSEIDGLYAGFTEPISTIEDKTGINSGIIMNIRDTDDSGFFKGEFDFAENQIKLINDNILTRNIRDGIHTFFGKLDFKLYISKSRHPFRLRENRVYNGSLYIVDRLDFSFDNYKIEDYLCAEYKIKHFREMQTLKFILKKVYRKDRPELPKEFILYKKMGASFEPYKNVKEVVFRGNTRSD